MGNLRVFLSATEETNPEIMRIDRYFMGDRNYEIRYSLTELHTFHLYFYDGKIRTNGEDYDIHAGDMSITPAKLVTTYAVEDGGVHLCMHFRYPLGEGWELPFVISRSLISPETNLIFLEIENLFNQTNIPGAMQIANCLLKKVIFDLYLATNKLNLSEVNKINRLIFELNQKLEMPFSVASLAHKYEWSQSQLSRVFKRSQGCTIPQYIMRQRIEKAKMLLLSSTLTIKEIGSLVGYQNPQEFNKRFRQITNQSPSYFRNN